MQTNELSLDLLRRLADFRPDGACVLSLFLNLDPSEFSTPAARATEVRALIDAAERQVRQGDNFTHEQVQALRRDIERVDGYFQGSEFSAEGAHGFALFACGPADLFETIRLPRPIDTRAVIDDS